MASDGPQIVESESLAPPNPFSLPFPAHLSNIVHAARASALGGETGLSVRKEFGMSQATTVVCYEGIQRIYRNAIVRYLRNKMIEAFGGDASDRVKKTFKAEEWEGIRTNAQVARVAGVLTTDVKDDFDLLSVNHFFGLFDVYWSQLVPWSTDSKQKQVFLSWLREVKMVRDPLSHPPETEFSYEDSFRLLDCARRALQTLHLAGC
jgi:hypothetical protein